MKNLKILSILIFFIFSQSHGEQAGETKERTPVKALYMPLADHYAGILAHHWYADDLVEADYRLERMQSWDLLRAAFRDGHADMAFIICPEAMAMFTKKPDFRWVGLLHRDGNQMIVNRDLAEKMKLEPKLKDRKPDSQLADLMRESLISDTNPIYCGIPALRATHTVVVYKYLKDHELEMSLEHGCGNSITAELIRPTQSLSFIRKRNNRSEEACMQQSLPWGSIVETRGDGQIAWYSKDVLKWPNGHVECIIIASDKALEEKRAAIMDVLKAIQKAGAHIEEIRRQDEESIQKLAAVIRSYVPEHTDAGVSAALDPESGGIRYDSLELDDNAIGSLSQIMNLAVEGGILERPINLRSFVDEVSYKKAQADE